MFDSNCWVSTQTPEFPLEVHVRRADRKYSYRSMTEEERASSTDRILEKASGQCAQGLRLPAKPQCVRTFHQQFFTHLTQLLHDRLRQVLVVEGTFEPLIGSRALAQLCRPRLGHSRSRHCRLRSANWYREAREHLGLDPGVPTFPHCVRLSAPVSCLLVGDWLVIVTGTCVQCPSHLPCCVGSMST